MVDICYVISFGFAARMLLQTGLIERLTTEGKRIAIITPDVKDKNLQIFQHNPRVEIHEAQAKSNIWSENYLFKRKYFLEDIKANPALWEKHVYSLWYSKSKHPWRRIRPLFYISIYHLIKIFPSIRSRFLRNEKRYLQSKSVQELLDKIKPKLLVATYPVNILEAQLLFAAKQNNIPSLLHLLSWDNITSKGRFPVTADHYILWGDVMRQELKEYYQIPDARIHVCGVPHFDHHIRFKNGNGYRAILKELGLNPDAAYLFFAMSAQRFAPKEIDIVEQLSSAIKADKFGKNIQLVIRPHPQNVQGNMANTSWLERLKKLPCTRVAIDFPRLLKSDLRWSLQQNDMDYLSKLLAGCAICLNSGSTISIEALLLDKPVILTSFDADASLAYWKSARRLVDYTHLKKLKDLGGISVVHSNTSLYKEIAKYLENPSFKQKERRHSAQQQCSALGGNATDLAVKAVGEVLECV